MGDRRREYGWLYPAAKAVLKPTFHAMFRIRVVGADNIPTTGPAIICPNHTSVIDSFLLPAVLPRRITFVGKSEYLDSWKTKHLFPALGMVPIDRSGGDAAERALAIAAEILGNGELFGIYPEGTRSRDGRLHKGRTGAARLAMRTGAPLVPVGIRGTRDIQPPGARAPRPFKSCEFHIGRPIDPEHYVGRSDERLALRQVTDEVMYEVCQLSGQEYVDDYAGSGRSSEPATAGAGAGGNGAATGRHGTVAARTIDAREAEEHVRLDSGRSSAEVLAAAE
jgi:1-acyl-sn-glycerol-3-phosphate acyltransferase